MGYPEWQGHFIGCSPFKSLHMPWSENPFFLTNGSLGSSYPYIVCKKLVGIKKGKYKVIFVNDFGIFHQMLT